MLPYLKEVQNASKKYSVLFRGLNYGEGTQDGEFSDTYNLSTSQYPCITQRAARVKLAQYEKPSTIHSKGKMLVIDGTKVLYDDQEVGTVTEGKKQTATVGNYIVIFPDKVYYRVPTEEEPTGEFGNMEEEYKVSGLQFTASSIMAQTEYTGEWLEFTSSSVSIGTTYEGDMNKGTGVTFADNYITGTNFPFKAGEVVSIEHHTNVKTDITITEATANKLVFDGEQFIQLANQNVTITRKVEGGFPFKAGDVITITGCSNTQNNKTELTVKKATTDELTFEENTFVNATEIGEIKIKRNNYEKFPFSKGDNVKIIGCSTDANNKEIIIRSVTEGELTFDNNSFTAGIEVGEVTLKREVPDLDFICESNYRLWGTHGNKIYSSKFSDPLNFASFEGLSNDSYAIEVGSEGEFTGCIPYSSHICFFKENTLHKLYGTKPSNFQIVTANVYGVQSGSEKSMHIVNEQLLYKGVGGIYSYTGGVPELVSQNFGNRRYSDAVACCDGEIYYISMRQGEEWHLFTYDVLKDIWLREDNTQAVDMVFDKGLVHYIDSEGGLYYIDKTEDRNDIEWGATFCTIHETINERKGYSKFHLRMNLSAGAWLAVDIKTDNETKWQQIYATHNERAKTVSIPIMPTRCDSIDIRIRGKGECTVKAFIREFTTGSDV